MSPAGRSLGRKRAVALSTSTAAPIAASKRVAVGYRASAPSGAAKCTAYENVPTAAVAIESELVKVKP